MESQAMILAAVDIHMSLLVYTCIRLCYYSMYIHCWVLIILSCEFSPVPLLRDVYWINEKVYTYTMHKIELYCMWIMYAFTC